MVIVPKGRLSLESQGAEQETGGDPASRRATPQQLPGGDPAEAAVCRPARGIFRSDFHFGCSRHSSRQRCGGGLEHVSRKELHRWGETLNLLPNHPRTIIARCSSGAKIVMEAPPVSTSVGGAGGAEFHPQDGLADQGGGIGHRELGLQIGAVGIDRFRADVELLRDLGG